MKIKMEFKKGILFIRLFGILNKRTYYKFEEEILPILLCQNIKYVVFNLDEVTYVDKYGLSSLLKANDIINKYNGKSSLCNITNRQVREALIKTEVNTKFYETSNELSALELFRI